jgi:uroporphyrinogen decarboxylase
MMSMSHRDRVLAALNHREPDRVPMDLGSTRNTSISIEAYEALLEHLGIDEGGSGMVDFGQSRILGVAAPSEAVLQRLDVDLRGLSLGKADESRERMLPDGSHQDELGVIRCRPPGSHYYDVVHSPFARDATVADLRKWEWPDPTDPGYTRGLREKALALRESTDCALALHLQDIIVHSSQYLRGFERWYTDFILEPDLMNALLDILLELRTDITVAALREVGSLVDVVSCSDDVADQRGPMISPTLYRRFIKPRHRRYLDAIRTHTPAKILFHTCGAITKLIPDLIDIGVDFLNPVQVSAAQMDTSFLKREYGERIGFWGAIDTSRVLPMGTVEEVRVEVQKRIRDLAPGGGFVLAAVHNIQPDVPAQNVVAMFEAGIESGSYPVGAG